MVTLQSTSIMFALRSAQYIHRLDYYACIESIARIMTTCGRMCDRLKPAVPLYFFGMNNVLANKNVNKIGIQYIHAVYFTCKLVILWSVPLSMKTKKKTKTKYLQRVLSFWTVYSSCIDRCLLMSVKGMIGVARSETLNCICDVRWSLSKHMR